MHDASIIEEIEGWLRACAQSSDRTSEHKNAEGAAPDSADPPQDQERPYWPYLESEDFWRE